MQKYCFLVRKSEKSGSPKENAGLLTIPLLRTKIRMQ